MTTLRRLFTFDSGALDDLLRSEETFIAHTHTTNPENLEIQEKLQGKVLNCVDMTLISAFSRSSCLSNSLHHIADVDQSRKFIAITCRFETFRKAGICDIFHFYKQEKRFRVLFSAPWRRKTSSREENFISLAGRLAFGSVFDGFRPSITCHKIDLNCFLNAARRSARQCVFSSSFGDHSKVMDEN
jgi:hypothetical protein